MNESTVSEAKATDAHENNTLAHCNMTTVSEIVEQVGLLYFVCFI
jgi:hypothetical protein